MNKGIGCRCLKIIGYLPLSFFFSFLKGRGGEVLPAPVLYRNPSRQTSLCYFWLSSRLLQFQCYYEIEGCFTCFPNKCQGKVSSCVHCHAWALHKSIFGICSLVYKLHHAVVFEHMLWLNGYLCIFHIGQFICEYKLRVNILKIKYIKHQCSKWQYEEMFCYTTVDVSPCFLVWWFSRRWFSSLLSK